MQPARPSPAASSLRRLWIRSARVWLSVLLALIAVSATADDAPTDPAKILQRADTLFQEEDWARAAEAYGSYLAATEGTPRARLQLGRALHRAGRHQEAIDVFEEVRHHPRAKPGALYGIALAAGAQGDTTKALEALRQAVAAGYRSPTPLGEVAELTGVAKAPGFASIADDARPASQRPVYRQLDFWIGDWKVYGRQQDGSLGSFAGTNQVEAHHGGFLITESWTGAGGFRGSSVNFFDAGTGKWHQVWNDASGAVTRYEGEWKGDRIELRGRRTNANRTEVETWMSFTPQDDGSVRQLIRHSWDGGATWTVAFDGLYVPADQAPAEESP